MKSSIKIGDKIGRLTVVSFDTKIRWGALCRCDCGTEKEIKKASFKNAIRSCGCLQKDKAKALKLSHGQSSRIGKTKTYMAWCNMKARCNNQNHPSYKDYGGRGITICESWNKSFEEFSNDMGERPHKATLDRKDRAGGS